MNYAATTTAIFSGRYVPAPKPKGTFTTTIQREHPFRLDSGQSMVINKYLAKLVEKAKQQSITQNTNSSDRTKIRSFFSTKSEDAKQAILDHLQGTDKNNFKLLFAYKYEAGTLTESQFEQLRQDHINDRPVQETSQAQSTNSQVINLDREIQRFRQQILSGWRRNLQSNGILPDSIPGKPTEGPETRYPYPVNSFPEDYQRFDTTPRFQ